MEKAPQYSNPLTPHVLLLTRLGITLHTRIIDLNWKASFFSSRNKPSGLGRRSFMSRAKKEILTYRAPWTVYSMSWCRGKEDYCSNFFRMAIGSFKEEYSNQVQVVQLFEEPSVSETGDRDTSSDPLYSFQPICQFDHPYPTTKV